MVAADFLLNHQDLFSFDLMGSWPLAWHPLKIFKISTYVNQWLIGPESRAPIALCKKIYKANPTKDPSHTTLFQARDQGGIGMWTITLLVCRPCYTGLFSHIQVVWNYC
jgi:hypothetical protein